VHRKPKTTNTSSEQEKFWKFRKGVFIFIRGKYYHKYK
jgi:hypothetical protein